MLSFVILLSCLALINSYILVKNADDVPFTSKVLDGFNGFKCSYQNNPKSGVTDLKAYYRGCLYVWEMIKILPQKPEPILLTQIFANLTSLGRIHNTCTGVASS